MTKKERRAAIEELRACADTWNVWYWSDLSGKPMWLEHPLAIDADEAMTGSNFESNGHSAVAVYMLEAAALLEDGWNPGEPLAARRGPG